MAKRVASTSEKLFSFDLESLLLSDVCPENQNTERLNSESCHHPKKFKTKNSKSLAASKVTMTNNEPKAPEKEAHNETEEVSDVGKFFENVGNDFNKSIQLRKSKLGHFTEDVILVYQSKFNDMLIKQRAEFDVLLNEEHFIRLEMALLKCTQNIRKMKERENKLTVLLQQHKKLIEDTCENQDAWVEDFRKMHDEFIEKIEKLKIKHRDEVYELLNNTADKVHQMQEEYLMISRKYEMEMTRNFLFIDY